MSAFFHTFFYQPIYNLSVFLISVLPAHNFGLAIIATTVLIKLALFPLTKKAILTQIKMKDLQPKLSAIKDTYKDDKQGEAQATMKLYREAKLNPFAGFLAMLIQLPVIICLYLIIYKAGIPHFNTELLYSFVTPPENVSMHFLIFDIAAKSWVLAILAGLTQFLQAHLTLTMATPAPTDPNKKPSFQDDFARSMNIQMKYVLPLIIVFIGHQYSSAVALYFIVSNLFTVGQELALRRHRNLLTA